MYLVFVVCMYLYLMTLWICGLKAYVEIFLTVTSEDRGATGIQLVGTRDAG